MNSPNRFIGVLLATLLAGPAFGLNQKPGSPLDDLPPYITRITPFGERADFSHDGKRILFIEKTYGDAYEFEIATGRITPVTHHYYHGGYTRALYLANGDILLSGSTSFDAAHPYANRREKAELWVLDKSLTRPPVPLGTKCFEGPAVSRKKMRICWVTEQSQYPATYAQGEHRLHVADIEYENGTPRLASQRTVLSNVDHPFFDRPVSIEPQNFIAPDETSMTLSLYGYNDGSEVSVVDLDTAAITVLTDTPGHHTEPEGIYPDGKHTLVESSRHFDLDAIGAPIQHIDIWKLSLTGEGEKWQRITRFSDYEGYKSSNPVVSDDGRFIAFQMAKRGDPAGVGRGLFLLDIQAMEKTRRQ